MFSRTPSNVAVLFKRLDDKRLKLDRVTIFLLSINLTWSTEHFLEFTIIIVVVVVVIII